MRKDIRSSSSPKALAALFPVPTLAEAMDEVRLGVDRFCLLAGVEALAEMMEEDATTVCGPRHRRHEERRGYRWGTTASEIGYHGGRVKVRRPRESAAATGSRPCRQGGELGELAGAPHPVVATCCASGP